MRSQLIQLMDASATIVTILLEKNDILLKKKTINIKELSVAQKSVWPRGLSQKYSVSIWGAWPRGQ